MKILIIARYFSPENTIGAIRPTKFAKYLSRMGHEVSVYACKPEIDLSDEILIKDAAQLHKIYRIGNSRFYQFVHDLFASRDKNRGGRPNAKPDAKPTEDGGKTPVAPSKIRDWVYHIMWIWCDYDQFLHYRRDTRADKTVYDAIFATWRTDCVHRMALDMIKRGRARAYVADFRDAVQSFWPELTKNRDVARLLRRVEQRADVITAAFPSILADSGIPADKKTVVLFNGYDPEDIAQLEPLPPDGRFHLCYCGQVYPYQDFSPVFTALSRLIQSGAMDREQVCIDYAGQSAERFLTQAAPFGLADLIQNHGFVTRAKALRLQKSAQLLLFAAWNDAAHPAIFPGKFLEYMMMEKPVLCTVAGGLPGSLPEHVMEETRLGYCAVQSGLEASQSGMEAYLLDQYERFQNGEPLLFAPDRAELSRYAYPALAKQLEGILTECCEGKERA